MRYGTCRVVLFTSSIRAMPTIQSMYYMSSERSFQLEYNAVEIVGNGPVVMENSGIKLDRIISQVWKALSYFPHISSSTLWNLIKFLCYLWKAIPKAHPTIQVSWSEDQILWRTSANTGIVPLSSYWQYW